MIIIRRGGEEGLYCMGKRLLCIGELYSRIGLALKNWLGTIARRKLCMLHTYNLPPGQTKKLDKTLLTQLIQSSLSPWIPP